MERGGLSIKGLTHLSSVFLAVEPSKIITLVQKYYTQKEDILLLYIGYHSARK